jgi:RNA binding exosome subunit
MIVIPFTVMNFYRVNFRTLVHATESEDKVEAALRFIVGEVDISLMRTKGHFGNVLVVMEVEISKKRQIKELLQRLFVEGIMSRLSEELEERMDEQCVLHFRLDKQRAYKEELELATNQDVIDCGIKIHAYPAKKKNAIIAARDDIEKLT